MQLGRDLQIFARTIAQAVTGRCVF